MRRRRWLVIFSSGAIGGEEPVDATLVEVYAETPLWAIVVAKEVPIPHPWSVASAFAWDPSHATAADVARAVEERVAPFTS